MNSEKDADFNRLVKSCMSMDENKLYKDQVLAMGGAPESWTEFRHIDCLKIQSFIPSYDDSTISIIQSYEPSSTFTKFEKYYSDDTITIQGMKLWFGLVPSGLKEQLSINNPVLGAKVLLGLEIQWSTNRKTSFGCTEGPPTSDFSLKPKEKITRIEWPNASGAVDCLCFTTSSENTYGYGDVYGDALELDTSSGMTLCGVGGIVCETNGTVIVCDLRLMIRDFYPVESGVFKLSDLDVKMEERSFNI